MKKILSTLLSLSLVCSALLLSCATTEAKSEAPAETTKKEVSNEPPSSDEMKSEKIARNEDGISIYPPKTYLKSYWDLIPGKLVHTNYYSTVCEKNRNIAVLLPPNYSAEKSYPVLYVLHGYWGNEMSMVGTQTLISNMINMGNAKEMIVVYPFIYSSKTKNQCTGFADPEDWAAYDNCVNEIVEDVMPWLKEKYSVLEGRENTAVCGFSMGGREALAIGVARPDLFGYVAAMAPAPGVIPNTMHPGQFQESELTFSPELTPKVLMICVGDCDSVVSFYPSTYHAVFAKNNVEHFWWMVPGSDHGDPAVSSGIFNFCERIFR